MFMPAAQKRTVSPAPFKSLTRHWRLYLMILPAFCITVVFAYIPLTGLIVAFKNYNMWLGFLKSPWAGRFGLDNIISIFTNPDLYGAVWNTVLLSILNLALGFPTPILLALMFNELRNGIFKRTVQTISYMPHFLSWISIVGLCYTFFSDYGPLNDLLSLIFGQSRERVLYLARQEYFLPLLLLLNLWQSVGWSSIIYLAAIAGLDPQLYEAAAIDGANRFQQTRYITLPGISTTAAIILILSMGGILGSNFELVFGLQNAYINFETIDTIIYKHGIQQRGYSLATALGFSRGMIALVITIGANYLSKRVNDVAVF